MAQGLLCAYASPFLQRRVSSLSHTDVPSKKKIRENCRSISHFSNFSPLNERLIRANCDSQSNKTRNIPPTWDSWEPPRRRCEIGKQRFFRELRSKHHSFSNFSILLHPERGKENWRAPTREERGKFNNRYPSHLFTFPPSWFAIILIFEAVQRAVRSNARRAAVISRP